MQITYSFKQSVDRPAIVQRVHPLRTQHWEQNEVNLCRCTANCLHEKSAFLTGLVSSLQRKVHEVARYIQP